LTSAPDPRIEARSSQTALGNKAFPTALTTSPDGLTRLSPKAMVTSCRPTTTL
jgi:hypothetical protein